MKIVKFLSYLLCYFIYPLSFLFPRKENILVFGSYRGAFNDNSKYLFIYANKHIKGYKCIWISTSKETARNIRLLGFEAYTVTSIKGFLYALIGKYWFVNSNTADILFCLSGGATVVNLWHGIPIKAIEFGITEGDLAKRYQDKEFWECFYHPACFRRPNFMVSTTPFYHKIFAHCFRISESQCLPVGCPRNQMLILPKKDIEIFIDQYESPSTKDLITKLHNFTKVYVYMPTWRDSQRDWFAGGIDLEALNKCMQQLNAITLLKPHSNTIVDYTREYSNLQFIDSSTDMYCILPFTDVLITDYSSVMYDYILMPKKHIILFHYDYNEYAHSREFLFPFEENIVGKRVYSFNEMIQTIIKNDFTIDPNERQRIIDKFWGHTMDANQDVCANILKAVL